MTNPMKVDRVRRLFAGAPRWALVCTGTGVTLMVLAAVMQVAVLVAT